MILKCVKALIQQHRLFHMGRDIGALLHRLAGLLDHDVEVRDRWADPVPSAYVDELVRHCPEFVKAYEPDGLSIDQFETYDSSGK